jgi:hypothetical protein
MADAIPVSGSPDVSVAVPTDPSFAPSNEVVQQPPAPTDDAMALAVAAQALLVMPEVPEMKDLPKDLKDEAKAAKAKGYTVDVVSANAIAINY